MNRLYKINPYNFMIGLVILLFTIFLIWHNRGTWFDKSSYPLTSFVKDYYVANSAKDTFAGNAVTGIYLDYRLFDTLFETMLLFVSVIAVYYFSRHQGDHE